MVNASDFIGLSKKKAQDVCEARSLIFRLVSVDGEHFLGYPEDVRDDRVCVEIKKEKVVAAKVQ